MQREVALNDLLFCSPIRMRSHVSTHIIDPDGSTSVRLEGTRTFTQRHATSLEPSLHVYERCPTTGSARNLDSVRADEIAHNETVGPVVAALDAERSRGG